jgi:iron complex outermembrane receptor protein
LTLHTSHLPRAGRATCRLAPFTALSLAAALQSAYAQTPAPAETTLREIRVSADQDKETATGPVIGYRAKRASTATKTDTLLSETPQAVTVVTSQQITDQGAANLQDALGYAAGVRSDAYGLDSRTDSVRVRGANPDNYLDGLREAYGYYTSRTRADPYTLERLEVLRGPSGMLFGAGTAAGVINMVSKRPQAEAQREVGVQYGSYGRKQVQVDLTGPLTQDGEWLYRLIALKRSIGHAGGLCARRPQPGRAFADLAAQRSHLADLAGAVAKRQKRLDLAVLPMGRHAAAQPQRPPAHEPLYRRARRLLQLRTQDLGLAVRAQVQRQLDGAPELPRLEQRERQPLPLRRLLHQPGQLGLRPGGQAPAGPHQRQLADAQPHHRAGQPCRGPFQHRRPAAHAAVRARTFARNRENVWSGATFSEIDAYAPVYGNLLVPDRTALPRTTQRQTGLYVQDQMKLDHWIVTAGLRHDKAVAAAEGSPEEESTATTKRLGLMYAFPSGWSPYVSYSESFTPQAAIKGQLFKPLRGEQWELGLKYEPAGRALAYSAALYDLREKNQIASPLPDVYTQVGATRTKGLELEVKGPVTPNLELVAHYNYTELDKQLEGLPKHQASAWAKYRFSIAGVNGFSAGAGVRWMGAFKDQQGGGNGPQIPSAALLDLMFAYDTANWRYAVNINNATDKTYFSTCLARGDCWYGARRNVVASATYRF